MGKFDEELVLAATRLRELSNQLDRSTKGEQRREQETEQRATAARLAAATLGSTALGSAFSAFNATGSVADAENAASSGVLDSLAKQFPTVASFFGIEPHRRAREEARREAVETLEPLARYNVPVSEELLQRITDTKVEQHERIEALRGRATARTSYGLTQAGEDFSKTNIGEKFSDAVGKLITWLDQNGVPLVGGRHR